MYCAHGAVSEIYFFYCKCFVAVDMYIAYGVGGEIYLFFIVSFLWHLTCTLLMGWGVKYTCFLL